MFDVCLYIVVRMTVSHRRW